MTRPWSQHTRNPSVADDIDFEIKGQELQFLEIELDPGESLFTTVYTHTGSGKARVAFSAPVPGAILPIKLSDVGGGLICQKDSFLAAARGVEIGIHFQRRILTGLFGGEGLFCARLRGPGKVWIQSLPFARLAGRMLAAAMPGGPGGNRGEGSMLGALGNLLDGD